MTVEARPIELWPVDKLIPYERNAKIHDEEQVDALVASIKEFGWTQPIVIDAEGVIIIGHGRRLAAIKLGLKQVPVDCRRDLTPAQVRSLRLSDNRVTSTKYDNQVLKIELSDLIKEAPETVLVGFNEAEITFNTEDIGEMDMDAFVGDIGEAVEEQRHNNERAAEEMDDVAAPLVDAFGFKRVSIAQSRRVRDFMNRIETDTGKTGVEALMSHIDRVLA